MSSRIVIPRWIKGLWGLLLGVLNLFGLLYVVSFASFIFRLESGGNTVFGRLLMNEHAFGGLFVIIGAAMLLSFIFMGLSLVHLVAWSEVPSERKLVWAAALFAGAQPAALIYWYLHVWREGVPSQSQFAQDRPPSPQKRLSVALLGVLTLVPPLYFVAFFGLVGFGIAGGGTMDGESLFRVLPIAHISVMLLWYVLIAIYLVDVFRNPRLDGNARALWAVVIAFAGPIGWPIYWYLNMWRPAAASVEVAGQEVSKER